MKRCFRLAPPKIGGLIQRNMGCYNIWRPLNAHQCEVMAWQCEHIQMNIVKSVNKITNFKCAARCRAQRKLFYPYPNHLNSVGGNVALPHIEFQKVVAFSMFLFANFRLHSVWILFYFVCLPIACYLALVHAAELCERSISHLNNECSIEQALDFSLDKHDYNFQQQPHMNT